MDAEPSPTESRWRGPWFPVTIGQVLAYAQASTGRLLVMAALAALLLAGTATELARTAWLPLVELCIRQLPPGKAELREQRLIWPDDKIQTLGNNGFLAVIVNPAGRPLDDLGPDIQVELAGDRVIFGWLIGYSSLPYPPMPVLALSREELQPLLGAWRPHLLAGLALIVSIGALVFWFAWGLCSAVPIRLAAALLGRSVTLAGCWRTGVAAWLPGTIPFAVALLLYQHRMVSLAAVAGVGAMAVLLSVILMIAVPFLLPLAAKRSPFGESPPVQPPPDTAPENPFGGGPAVPSAAKAGTGGADAVTSAALPGSPGSAYPTPPPPAQEEEEPLNPS